MLQDFAVGRNDALSVADLANVVYVLMPRNEDHGKSMMFNASDYSLSAL